MKKQLTKSELKRQIKAMRVAGGMCANVCYNLAQQDHVLADDARSMTKAYKAWDEATRLKGERRT